MKYTAGQAAKAVGVATATITRSLKSGRISGEKNESGTWMIDPSELHRVFPTLATQDPARPCMKGDATPITASERPYGINAEGREIQVLKEALADAREDRDKWRDMAERLSIAPPTNAQRKGWWPW